MTPDTSKGWSMGAASTTQELADALRHINRAITSPRENATLLAASDRLLKLERENAALQAKNEHRVAALRGIYAQALPTAGAFAEHIVKLAQAGIDGPLCSDGPSDRGSVPTVHASPSGLVLHIPDCASLPGGGSAVFEPVGEISRKLLDTIACRPFEVTTNCGGWVPVSERLPAPFDTVAVAAGAPIAHRAAGFVNEAGEWLINDGLQAPRGYVHHWFAVPPAPQPPHARGPESDRYTCTVCHAASVDSAAGFDTCPACAGRV